MPIVPVNVKRSIEHLHIAAGKVTSPIARKVKIKVNGVMKEIVALKL